MKNKINKILNLMLLLSILNGNILSMQKSDIEQADIVMQESGEAQAMEIEQGGQQELSLLGLPDEVKEHILYQIVEPYEAKVKDVNNIFEFYSQLDLKQLVSNLRGALLASTKLGGVTSGLIKSLLKKKYDRLVKPIKDQYKGLSKDELNSRLRDVLNRYVNRNDLEEAAKLILAGANVNEKNNNGNTALMSTVKYGHKDIVELLIGNRANVNEKNKYRFAILMFAAMFGHKDIAQLLINNGANVDEKGKCGDTALITAASHGREDIVQLLIDNGADVNEKNNAGDTALMVAIKYGHEDIAELLVAVKNKENQNN